MSKKSERSPSVWDAIADTPEQAANLRVRAELMQKIAAIVTDSGWTQAEMANRCGVTQPRINDLLRGRVSRFSLDALVNVATALGCRVRVDLEAACTGFCCTREWTGSAESRYALWLARLEKGRATMHIGFRRFRSTLS